MAFSNWISKKKSRAKTLKGGKRTKPVALTRSRNEGLLGQLIDAILYKRAELLVIASGETIDRELELITEEIYLIRKENLFFFRTEDLRSLPKITS